MEVNDESVMYPVELVKVNNFLFRAFIDTAGGSFNTALVLQSELNLHKVRKDTASIELMMYSTRRRIDVLKIKI